MIVNPPLPRGHSIFCDDIRAEVGGKVSLMGVYAGQMIIHGVAPGAGPTLLPKLCVHTSFFFDIQKTRGSGKIKALMEFEGSDELLGEIDMDFSDTPSQVGPPSIDPQMEFHGCTTAPFVFSPFLIKGESRLKIRAFVGDDEIRMGSLVITFSNDPVAG